MQELLAQYSVSEIILFIFLLAMALKKFVQLVDWYKNRARKAIKEKDRPEELAAIAKVHDEQLNSIKEELSSLKSEIQLLLDSDRDDIKQSLTKDHHYFCYKLGSIDDYSLDCMEKRFSHYQDEGGNSFIQTLMQDVRALPRKLEKENR